MYNIQQSEWTCSQILLWNSNGNGALQNRVRPEGCPSCASVLQALISSGITRLWNFIPCSSERGIFVFLDDFARLLQLFLQKDQNEGTSKPSNFKGLEDSDRRNLAATFFADLRVSSTQSAAALADFVIVQPCIDIHRRGEVRVSQHALQNLWWDDSAVGCDGGIAMTQLMRGKGSDADLL